MHGSLTEYRCKSSFCFVDDFSWAKAAFVALTRQERLSLNLMKNCRIKIRKHENQQMIMWGNTSTLESSQGHTFFRRATRCCLNAGAWQCRLCKREAWRRLKSSSGIVSVVLWFSHSKPMASKRIWKSTWALQTRSCSPNRKEVRNFTWSSSWHKASLMTGIGTTPFQRKVSGLLDLKLWRIPSDFACFKHVTRAPRFNSWGPPGSDNGSND